MDVLVFGKEGTVAHETDLRLLRQLVGHRFAVRPCDFRLLNGEPWQTKTSLLWLRDIQEGTMLPYHKIEQYVESGGKCLWVLQNPDCPFETWRRYLLSLPRETGLSSSCHVDFDDKLGFSLDQHPPVRLFQTASVSRILSVSLGRYSFSDSSDERVVLVTPVSQGLVLATGLDPMFVIDCDKRLQFVEHCLTALKLPACLSERPRAPSSHLFCVSSQPGEIEHFYDRLRAKESTRRWSSGGDKLEFLLTDTSPAASQTDVPDGIDAVIHLCPQPPSCNMADFDFKSYATQWSVGSEFGGTLLIADVVESTQTFLERCSLLSMVHRLSNMFVVLETKHSAMPLQMDLCLLRRNNLPDVVRLFI